MERLAPSLRMTLPLGILFALSTSMGAVAAPSAEICYSDATSTSLCLSATCVLPTNTTVFHCPNAGNKTIGQLASEGWWVVSLRQRTSKLVGPNAEQKEMLVLRSHDRIFTNGFE